jgi:plasmid stabilization system protein ParE
MSELPVILASRVDAALDANCDWWAKHRSAEQASRWLRGIEKAILGLAKNPERFGLAPENGHFPIEVRQLLFGLGRTPTHRVLFTIRPDSVFVFDLRHVSQELANLDDLL